ncbi:uncharacterized protein LOC142523737 [Primulina tabacum]|uniref:uncharacterized protein LOC142523737 n=1 Tax=Primulina tabacum TaxID=48773 RepID=UPI003F594CE7
MVIPIGLGSQGAEEICMEVEGMRRKEVVISFGPVDFKGVNLPHNNALVIQARVANYDIMRVFVDSGISVNVIFKEALIQMDLHGYRLETVETALFGFAGHAVYPEGEIVLPLTLGTRELKKTIMTTFIVADAPSSYNIILGRPTMNELRAVASVYHLKIKFSVGSQVGEVRGDQPSSRKCYVETVRVEQKKARREQKRASGSKEGERVVEKGEVQFVTEEEQEVVEIKPDKEIRVARDLDLSTRELIGISPLVAEHHLNILPGSQPIKQKKRHFGPEKDKVIDVHVRDLLLADHIREIQFPTRLSNVVLVPKATGKWRMCVDFRDLNKAYPKDHYPLPRIDQLVDSTSGLKNVWVTYQRLMNKLFEKQLRRNVEVYVDDILGKSREFSGFISDLEETFATLMHYGIKLNPAKCIFGVKSSKFLGFMVTDRGIEVLRKAQKFGWDEKCEQTFQDLKSHLAELPVLVKPEPEEKLVVYLSTTEYAVSSVLIKK